MVEQALCLFFTLQNADIFLTRSVGGKDPAGDTGVTRGHTVAQEQDGDVPVLEECCTAWGVMLQVI